MPCVIPGYEGYRKHQGELQVRYIRGQMLWVLVTLSLLGGCQPLEDVSKILGDLFKSITPRLP